MSHSRPIDPNGPGPFGLVILWPGHDATEQHCLHVASNAANLPDGCSAWHESNASVRMGELLARFAQAGGDNGEMARIMIRCLKAWADDHREQDNRDASFGAFLKEIDLTIAAFTLHVPEM